MEDLLSLFSEIRLEDPEDAVIEQIRGLVLAGKLQGGDRLPSERRLEERLKLTRNVISRAFRRLESFGILKTLPQSGTYLAHLSVEALDGLISNVVRLDEGQIGPLTGTRAVLESYAVELIIAGASDADIGAIAESVRRFREHVEAKEVHFDEDMVFHLKLAAASGNPVLKSMLTRLIVSSMELLNAYEASMGREALLGRLRQAVLEHAAVVAALEARDLPAARTAIAAHFAAAGGFLSRT